MRAEVGLVKLALVLLTVALSGLIAACSSGATVADTPPPTTRAVPAPTESVPPTEISVPQFEPTPDQLSGPRATVTAWFDEHESPYKRIYIHHLTSALWDSALWDPEFRPGVYVSGWDGAAEQFTYEVLTETTKVAIEERAVAIGLPLSMLSIEVRGQLSVDNPPVKSQFGEFGISLDLGDPQNLIAPIEFAVELINKRTQSTDITLGAYPADIVVLSVDGTQLWRHQPPVISAIGFGITLPPEQGRRFIVEWDGADDDGIPLPAGDYLVRGFIHFNADVPAQNTTYDLATAAIPFTLSAAP